MVIASIFGLLLALGHSCMAQEPPPANSGQSDQTTARVPPQMSPYAQEREAVLAPALEAMKKRDYDGALDMLHTALEKYPNDGRVLLLAANAARLSKHYDEALLDYQKANSQPHTNWTAEFGLIETYAALGRWDDFDVERQKVRAAKQANDPTLAKVGGYLIDTFSISDKQVSVMEFPALAGRFHTRYRFFIAGPQPADQKNGGWTPFVDLESDDIDQVEFAKKHPEDAAAGKRSFSLDGYSRPNTHATLKFYPDSEPTYREVRADVIANLSGTLKPMSTTTHK
ncbi:MAG TPA: tetratricopeptide repeat protein [Bryobacteraceae bacterium]|nr:tetratricopeptide repeat protein [Bryobacteraceae bacterium]